MDRAVDIGIVFIKAVGEMGADGVKVLRRWKEGLFVFPDMVSDEHRVGPAFLNHGLQACTAGFDSLFTDSIAGDGRNIELSETGDEGVFENSTFGFILGNTYNKDFSQATLLKRCICPAGDQSVCRAGGKKNGEKEKA